MPFRVNLREVFRVHHFSVDVDAQATPGKPTCALPSR